MQKNKTVPRDNIEIDVGVGKDQSGVDVIEESRLDVAFVDETVFGEYVSSQWILIYANDGLLTSPTPNFS